MDKYVVVCTYWDVEQETKYSEVFMGKTNPEAVMKFYDWFEDIRCDSDYCNFNFDSYVKM